jgi:hypothetical protein
MSRFVLSTPFYHLLARGLAELPNYLPWGNGGCLGWLIDPAQSLLGIVQAVAGGGEHEADRQADSAQSTGKVIP